MLGAIIGDIIGSRFEFNNLKEDRLKFDLFTKECNYTDDTICTIAIADAILKNKSYEQSTIEWCSRYPTPMGGYGGSFNRWLNSKNKKPYNSFGNGSAMRVSPIGFAFKKESEVVTEAFTSAMFTHDHEFGLIGAVSVAKAIYLLRRNHNKKDAVDLFGKYYNKRTPAPRIFDETCQGTVPACFHIFLESESFEDAMRRAMEWGGDSDTIGTIVGGMAEAYYGIPSNIRINALEYLPEEMKDVVFEFEDKFQS